ncbi:uncharacterized protein LY89DRAFT_675771 [Mollisia scopiformis]|uniref:Uncharacterized protein n=1 Tax=Mollisia scopiformis TaxID=149040 RepID=A0A132BB09_MOLSC|nr:uncharacterized protein LY89DRAFT_675771 [Mollisia scopiformis]KUJ09602.1 hypothetical protein LY89DRAFT_675771 [Mollisia scopiformis]
MIHGPDGFCLAFNNLADTIYVPRYIPRFPRFFCAHFHTAEGSEDRMVIKKSRIDSFGLRALAQTNLEDYPDLDELVIKIHFNAPPIDDPNEKVFLVGKDEFDLMENWEEVKPRSVYDVDVPEPEDRNFCVPITPETLATTAINPRVISLATEPCSDDNACCYKAPKRQPWRRRRFRAAG